MKLLTLFNNKKSEPMKVGSSSDIIKFEAVCSWIYTHRNPETLEFIRRHVDSIPLADEYKTKLYALINAKEAKLLQQPLFKKDGDNIYYLTEDGEIKDYASRFSACCKLAQLTLRSYDVGLVTNGKMYRIVLNGPHLRNMVTNQIIAKPFKK